MKIRTLALVAILIFALSGCRKEKFVTLYAQRTGTNYGSYIHPHNLTIESDRNLGQSSVTIYYSNGYYMAQPSTRVFLIRRGQTYLGTFNIGQINQVLVNGYPVMFRQY